ncbi:uncharacterized protein [Rutidosis leptorrhynchoides]|uniref:uncharacterized protein n=1 Tax=Rutidosis leptorrhynchoides TaxID=125765 RepID=UPI003A996518
MELEATRFKAQEELNQKDDQLTHLKHLLTTAINEKKEAQNLYQTLLNYHRTTTVPPPYSAVSSIDDEREPITNTNLSFSDCEESIVSSPVTETPVGAMAPACLPELNLCFPVRVLPEKGKLLEAVIKAGPLLQNLLLAGPLPDWRHPPPPLDSYRIPPPPVVMPPVRYLFEKKRGFDEGSEPSTETKYQRIAIN